MAMEVMNSYGSYAMQYMTGNSTASGTKKKDTEQTAETANSSKSKSTADYASELEKLVPSVEFRAGNACASDKSGKSLTVNSKLLEKMQNDPEIEKNMKDMIKGVESMSKIAESMAKASGWTIVYQHSYIDENGKYHCRMQGRNDFMLNMSDKLREERWKNSEKLIEKSKERAKEKREELQEALAENKTETEDKKTDGEQEKSGVIIAKENTPLEKMEQMLLEKLENSEDGEIYLDDDDMQMILDVAKEETQGQTDKVKNLVVAGNNFDMKI